MTKTPNNPTPGRKSTKPQSKHISRKSIKKKPPNPSASIRSYNSTPNDSSSHKQTSNPSSKLMALMMSSFQDVGRLFLDALSRIKMKNNRNTRITMKKNRSTKTILRAEIELP